MQSQNQNTLVKSIVLVFFIASKRCCKRRVEPLESGQRQDEMAGSSAKVVAPGDEAFTPAVQLQKQSSAHVSYPIIKGLSLVSLFYLTLNSFKDCSFKGFSNVREKINELLS